MEGRDEVRADFQKGFLKKTTQEWLDILLAEDIWCAPVNDFAAVEADPQIARERDDRRVGAPEGGHGARRRHPGEVQRHPGRDSPPRPAAGRAHRRRFCASSRATARMRCESCKSGRGELVSRALRPRRTRIADAGNTPALRSHLDEPGRVSSPSGARLGIGGFHFSRLPIALIQAVVAAGRAGSRLHQLGRQPRAGAAAGGGRRRAAWRSASTASTSSGSRRASGERSRRGRFRWRSGPRSA